VDIRITSNFDGGNIRVISTDDPANVHLEIRPDKDSDFFQWFFFRLTGARERDCRLNILNAAKASYVEGWRDYRAVASYDRKTWFRVPTEFDGTVLTIAHSIYYAYFAPYSMERHADLIGQCLKFRTCTSEVLGNTLDGQDLDMLTIAAPGVEAGGERKVCWVIARQHPGETMAEWWVEGFVKRLLDERDPVARALLERATFHVVANMNPDGGRRGHLRTNAAGANLNREWSDPSMEQSPEVFLVRERMRETGVDFLLDVHGDEALPYNQIEHGYPENQPGKANLSMAANHAAETYGCLAMTLEMPFKDSAITPDPTQGWSPERCRKLGFSNLDALYAVIDRLR
jgi:murein tripeptide amidase MpaA